MHKLRGETFHDFQKYDWNKYGYLAGQTIARFQIALQDCEIAAVNIMKVDNYSEVINWAIPRIKDNLSANITEKAFSVLDEYVSIFSILYYKLPRQLTHNDLHGHNILFQDEEFTGIIDLDSSVQNVKIFDLISFSGWLLYCMRNNRASWLPSLSAILHGYISIIHLTTDEINSIFFMLYTFGLICIAKFIEISSDDIVLKGIEALDWIVDNRKSLNKIESILLASCK